MKKYLVMFLILFSGSVVFAADKFMENFEKCTPYTETQESQMLGVSVSSTLQIVGKQGGKCGFRNTSSMPHGDMSVECWFTMSQIKKIVSSIEDNEAEISAVAGSNIESVSEISTNEAYLMLNRYLQDPKVCTMSN